MKKITALMLLIMNSSKIIPSQASRIIKAAVVISVKTFSLEPREVNHQAYLQSAFKAQSIAVVTNAKKQALPAKKVISSQQALKAIEQNIVTIFDDNDTDSLLDHLKQIEGHSKHLDPVKNKKQIKAIEFISDNKDKSSIMNFQFWYNAWYETEVLKGLPIPQPIRDIPCSEMVPKIITLSKKL